MLTSNVQLGYVLTRGGGKLSRAVYLASPLPRISNRMDNQQILLHHLLQEYLVERDINFISINLRCLRQLFSWVTYWQGVGASCPGRFILPPPPRPEFQIVWISANFITPSTTVIFSWKGYKLYFSQSEMLTSNVQLGYVLTRDGGQAVPGGLSCPPPRNSERMDNPQILLHHLLWEYLVERDINFVSVNLRCLLQTFSWVAYWQGVGGGASCPGQFILPPAQNCRENG